MSDRGPGAAKRWRYVALHAAGAGAFVFMLQQLLWRQSLETSLLWAVCFAVAAGMLALRQIST